MVVRKAGIQYFVDIHVQADPATSLQDAHVIAGCVKGAIRHAVPAVAGVLVHMEPYEKAESRTAGSRTAGSGTAGPAGACVSGFPWRLFFRTSQTAPPPSRRSASCTKEVAGSVCPGRSRANYRAARMIRRIRDQPTDKDRCMMKVRYCPGR